jgi:protein ImuB
MALADARAICPDLATRPADLAREAAALATLRRWAGRYAPMVATDGADGLMADISGVPHLFGGEEDLRQDLQARLDRAGWRRSAPSPEPAGRRMRWPDMAAGSWPMDGWPRGSGHCPSPRSASITTPPRR